MSRTTRATAAASHDNLCRVLRRQKVNDYVKETGNKFVWDFNNGYIDFDWDHFDEEIKLFKRAI